MSPIWKIRRHAVPNFGCDFRDRQPRLDGYLPVTSRGVDAAGWGLDFRYIQAILPEAVGAPRQADRGAALRRLVRGCCVTALLLTGCAGSGSPPPTDPPAPVVPATQASSPSPAAPAPAPVAVAAQPAPTPSKSDSMQRPVATIDGQTITLQQLIGPLLESHGLPVLLNLVGLRLAEKDAADAGVTVSEADFQSERDATLGQMFKDNDDRIQDQIDKAVSHGDNAAADRLRNEMRRDNETLLDQFLRQKGVTVGEFDTSLRINTYLRKIAEPQVNKSITEQSLRAAFNQLYGETVLVRMIQLKNQSEVADAQRRLAKGEKFDDVAREMSHNRLSAELGGELPRFSRQAPGYPASFKDVAFSLQPGQVSDPVEADGSFYLIKMEARFAPEAVKYELVRDAVRKQLFTAAVASLVKNMRAELGNRIARNMKVDDPIIRQQYEKATASQAPARADTIRQDMSRQRLHDDAATQPGIPQTVRPREDGELPQPGDGPTLPAPVDSGAIRPPATLPAAGH